MSTINQLSAVSALSGGDLLPVFVTSNGDCRKSSVSVITTYVSQNLGDALGDSISLANYVKTTGKLVSALPSAVTVGAGARAFVTDSNAALSAGHGNSVVGGGANAVPVYSDGSSWRIG